MYASVPWQFFIWFEAVLKTFHLSIWGCQPSRPAHAFSNNSENFVRRLTLLIPCKLALSEYKACTGSIRFERRSIDPGRSNEIFTGHPSRLTRRKRVHKMSVQPKSEERFLRMTTTVKLKVGEISIMPRYGEHRFQGRCDRWFFFYGRVICTRICIASVAVWVQ